MCYGYETLSQHAEIQHAQNHMEKGGPIYDLSTSQIKYGEMTWAMGWLYSRVPSKSVHSLLQVRLRTDCNHKLKYNCFTLSSLCY